MKLINQDTQYDEIISNLKVSVSVSKMTFWLLFFFAKPFNKKTTLCHCLKAINIIYELPIKLNFLTDENAL